MSPPPHGRLGSRDPGPMGPGTRAHGVPGPRPMGGGGGAMGGGDIYRSIDPSAAHLLFLDAHLLFLDAHLLFLDAHLLFLHI